MVLAKQSVCTIGYQGRSIEDFVEQLCEEGIEVLVDVRRRALSRKPGFSKTQLSQALARKRIEYLHFPDLGMPEDLMPRRNLTDNSEILALYNRQLLNHERSISRLRETAGERRICLLCFESDHRLCHRYVLATALEEEFELEAVHL